MSGKVKLKLWNGFHDASSLNVESIRAWVHEFLNAFLSALVQHSRTVKRWFVSKPLGRRRRRKVSVLTAYFLIQLFFYIKLNVDTHNTHELDTAQTPVFPCKRTPEEAKALRDLFYDVHEILDQFKVRHFLIYGSIWGAMRSKGPLPWDYDIDLGIHGNEEFAKIPRAKFVKAFQERGIRVNDKMHQASVFYLSRGKFAQVDLDVFFDYNGWMQRAGLISWILYYNYKTYHTFPTWMLQEPLPTMQFFDVQMPVPRGAKQILKYLYPKDWETPFTPAACQGKDITLSLQSELTDESPRHVEISEQVVDLGAEDPGSDDPDDDHVIANDDEDVLESIELKVASPKTVKRNAMGEYIPAEGEKALTQQALSGPGPSTYAPVIGLTKPVAPQYSIVGKMKDKKEFSSPGPKYDTSKDMVWKNKTRSLKAKLETSPYRPKTRDHLTCSLGSAAYKVEYYDTGKHAPRCTIGSRFDEPIIFGPPNMAIEPVDTKGFTAPGPNYSPCSGRGMEKSFGLKFQPKRDKGEPGPAEYTVRSSERGPRYSLGHKLRDQTAFGGPGPASYDIKSSVGSGVATSIRGRQSVPLKYSVPSPNTYVLPDAFRDAPRHSMTYRAFETEVCETPGPANYNQICRNMWQAPPEFSCRKQCRPSYPAILNYPEYGLMNNEDVGPDTYDADKGFDKNSSPAYSMGNRRRIVNNEYPGPNHYNITLPCRPDGEKAPEFSMGQATKKVSDSNGPGPAAYHPKAKKTSKGYSMSSRPKPLKTVKPTPAPNAYKVSKGQTCKGIYNGGAASLKSRASPYVYSGFPNLARITT